LIDDFEGQPPAGTSGWESYFQDNTDTQLTCELDSETRHAGSAALQFQFDVAASSWATCGFYFDETKNWSTGQGISFYLRADRAGIPFDVDLYGGDPGGHTTYVLHTETFAESVNDWALIEIRWDDILRTEWEEDPGTPFDPNLVTGFSIGLSTPENKRLHGTIWLDDLTLLGNQPASTVTTPLEASPPAEAPEPSEPAEPSLPCVGAITLPLTLVGMAWEMKKRR
jgi:hypothetical protein